MVTHLRLCFFVYNMIKNKCNNSNRGVIVLVGLGILLLVMLGSIHVYDSIEQESADVSYEFDTDEETLTVSVDDLPHNTYVRIFGEVDFDNQPDRRFMPEGSSDTFELGDSGRVYILHKQGDIIEEEIAYRRLPIDDS